MRLVQFIDEDKQIYAGKELTSKRVERLKVDEWGMPVEPTGEIVDVEAEQRVQPIHPRDVFCIGMNYRSHVEEMGGTVPQRPVVFMKPTSTVIGPGAPIRIPKCEHDGPETDQEAELAVVIGRRAKDVLVEDALDYVLGYTCANDVSARWWQKDGGGGQFTRGKGFDTFCPLGPVLVTHGQGEDEICDPQNLRITGSLDGEVMQDTNTSDMIFSVAELIAFLSQDTTLMPGAVILTGTPPGVGWAREPKKLMRPGMVSKIEIERVGVLENPVL
ncbi:MAG: fumarylacetoacetate hydrolase family protein [Planctomycetota bacterium]